MTYITITLGLPDRSLSPNARCHWAKKAKAAKLQRSAAWALAREAMNGKPCRWVRASAHAEFFWPDASRHDYDNANAMLKSAYDGLVDAGVLWDDDSSHLRHEPTTFCIDRKKPRVEITVREVWA